MSSVAVTARPSFGRILIAGIVWGPALGAVAAVILFVAAAIIPGATGGTGSVVAVVVGVIVGAIWGLVSGFATSVGASISSVIFLRIAHRPVLGIILGSAAVAFASTWWFFERVLVVPGEVAILIAALCGVAAVFVMWATWVYGSPGNFVRKRVG